MKFAAYIRISDKNRGTASAQREAIEAYCKAKKITVSVWTEEYVSASKTDVEERELMKLVDAGYSIVMTDVSRLGRRKVFDLIGVIGRICKHGELHFAYTERAITRDNVDDAETIFTVVGSSFAAVEESKRRSDRAKAGHQTRHSKGLKSGRAVGAVVRSKLDDYAALIISELEKGTKKTALVTLLEKKGCKVSRAQLYNWISKRTLKEQNNTINHLNNVKRQSKAA